VDNGCSHNDCQHIFHLQPGISNASESTLPDSKRPFNSVSGCLLCFVVSVFVKLYHNMAINISTKKVTQRYHFSA